MTRLIFVTQSVDPDDPVLGATTAKIAALASRVDDVVVLADRAVADVLPANCRVRLFASDTRLGRGLRFEQALAAELARRPRPAAVIAHMCPIYAVLAAPLARPVGVRVMLWYAHWNRTKVLEAAVRASNTVISVDARSVPVASPKVVGIGHGIDVADFVCSEPLATGAVELLALGRYSAAKGLDTMIRAVGRARAAGAEVRFRAHGTSANPQELVNLDRLRALVEERGLGDSVALLGPVPRTAIPGVLAGATALVNNMRPGAPDKVVYEACASCRPAIVSNPSFDELLGDVIPSLHFELDDDAGLAERIIALSSLDLEERRAIGLELRSRVLERHSVGSWADAVVRLSARTS